MNKKRTLSQFITKMLYGFAVVYFFGLSLSEASVVISENEIENKVVLTSSGTGSSVKYFHSVENRFFYLEKNTIFWLKAYIEPVKESETSILSTKKIDIPNQAFICKSGQCSKTWDFDFKDKPISIEEFNHFLISWSQSIMRPDPEIIVEADLSLKSSKNKNSRVTGYFGETSQSLKKVKTINMKEAKYTEKSYSYLVKRELGIKADKKWRYSVSNNELLLQSRIDLPLKDVQTVQVISDGNFTPRIVQFSIDTEGNGRRDRYMLFDQINHTQEIRNGQSVLNLDLWPAIKRLRINPEKANLMEIIIFTPTTFQSYLKDKPIDEVRFLKYFRPNMGKHIIPQAEKQGEHYSLDFNFATVSDEQSVTDGKIEKIRITAKLNGPQFVKWNSICVYNSLEEQIPALAFMPEKALKSWGKVPLQISSFERIYSFRPIWGYLFQKSSELKFIKIDNSKYDESKYDESKYDESKYDTDSTSVFVCYDLNKEAVNKNQWYSKETTIKGKTWCYIFGKKNNSSVQGQIILENAHDKKEFPFYFWSESNWSVLPEATPKKIVGFEFKGPLYVEQWPFQFAWFDVQTRTSNRSLNYKECEWWLKDVELPLKIAGENYQINKKKKRVCLFTNQKKRNKWTFHLPKIEYLFPFQVILPGPLPQPCRMLLKINGQETKIHHGSYVLPINTFGYDVNAFELSLEYMGTEPIIWFDIPMIKVMGLKQTPMNDLNKIQVIIDDKITYLNFSHLPDTQGEWMDLGKVRLEPGKHHIRTLGSKFFNIKTLNLESDSPPSWSDRRRGNSVDEFLWQRIFKLVIKPLILLLIGFYAYRFRGKILLAMRSMFASVNNYYSRFSDRKCTIIWILITAVLYGFGISEKLGQGEHYGFTFGGIAMVMVLFHIGKVARNMVYSTFPKAAYYMYRSRGSIFLTWAMALMVIAVILVITKLELLAELVTIVIYYLLVVGVIIEIIRIEHNTDIETGRRQR